MAAPEKSCRQRLVEYPEGVLLDCGAKSQLERRDVAWSRTRPIDPFAHFWGYASIGGPYQPSPVQELANLLDWGCQNEVITGAVR